MHKELCCNVNGTCCGVNGFGYDFVPRKIRAIFGVGIEPSYKVLKY
ncbi:hypothetical protein [uncultured Tenacibaculum sp.]|nr:hypothetical protein [uncultured Tenacibaculum sp.]